MFKASNDIEYDITDVANKGNYDLLLIGLGQSIFEGSFLGKVLGFTTRLINPEKLIKTVTGKEKLFDNSPFDERTRFILENSQVPVGIFINKNLSKIEKVIIPVFEVRDFFLITYAKKLINNNESQITILDERGIIKANPEVEEKIRLIKQSNPNNLILKDERVIEKLLLQQQDLMVISIDSWKKLVEAKCEWFSDIPSTLIITEGTKG